MGTRGQCRWLGQIIQLHHVVNRFAKKSKVPHIPTHFGWRFILRLINCTAAAPPLFLPHNMTARQMQNWGRGEEHPNPY